MFPRDAAFFSIFGKSMVFHLKIIFTPGKSHFLHLFSGKISLFRYKYLNRKIGCWLQQRHPVLFLVVYRDTSHNEQGNQINSGGEYLFLPVFAC